MGIGKPSLKGVIDGKHDGWGGANDVHPLSAAHHLNVYFVFAHVFHASHHGVRDKTLADQPLQ